MRWLNEGKNTREIEFTSQRDVLEDTPRIIDECYSLNECERIQLLHECSGVSMKEDPLEALSSPRTNKQYGCEGNEGSTSNVLNSHMESIDFFTDGELSQYASVAYHFNELLERHSSLIKSKSFKRNYRNALAYLVMHSFLENEPLERLSLRAKSRFFANKFSISSSLVRQWLVKKRAPQLIRWLVNREGGDCPSLSGVVETRVKEQSEKVKQIRMKLGRFQTKESIYETLQEQGMAEIIKLWPTYEQEWNAIQQFYDLLNMIDEGLTPSKAAKSIGVSYTRALSWLNGTSIPIAIRIAVYPESERVKIHKEKIPIGNLSLEDLGIDFSKPLEMAVLTEYPYIAKHPNYDELINRLKEYLNLCLFLEGKDEISNAELSSFAKGRGISLAVLRSWARGVSRPEICKLVLQAQENAGIANKLIDRLNPKSIDDIDRLIDQLYIQSHLKSWENYEKLREDCSKYFRFLSLLQTGNSVSRICDEIGIDEGTGTRWMKGQVPHLLKLVSKVPSSPPARGSLWLPLEINRKSIMERFIEVPKRIDGYDDIDRICTQLEISPPDLMYVMGFTLADGYIQPTSRISYSLRCTLGGVYSWSKTILDSLRRILTPIQHDRIMHYSRKSRMDSVYEYSSSSPFFLWLREQFFELESDSQKTYTEFQGEWLLDAPESYRISFLQGLADGDGYASVKAMRVGIGSITNGEFISRLLESLEIKSNLRDIGVEIIRHDSLLKSASLPLFKHAHDKTLELTEICAILKARPKRKRVSEFEKAIIHKLAKEKKSSGEILLYLWRKHKISRNKATINRIMKESLS